MKWQDPAGLPRIVAMPGVSPLVRSPVPARFLPGDSWRLPESPCAYRRTSRVAPKFRCVGRGTRPYIARNLKARVAEVPKVSCNMRAMLPEHGAQENRDGTRDRTGAHTLCRQRQRLVLCYYRGLTTDLRIHPSANWVQLWRYQLPFASSTTMVAPW